LQICPKGLKKLILKDHIRLKCKEAAIAIFYLVVIEIKESQDIIKMKKIVF